ncbi:chorion class CA protein ERA.1-like [Maniola hyperantus]|uniref:chorion class CA protein ERA.1-like n=1 Tax=Aphantopus hyperantus TaxID=2795564 RepID=UPI001569A0A7|nr:chorion class CA protein ERA.1-like [Maniola hyperantus]
MNTFAVLLLCVQACLVQNVWGRYCGAELIASGCGGAYGLGAYGPRIGPYGLADGVYGLGLGAPLAYGGCSTAYGGEGIGVVVVTDQLPVAGTTLVAGQVPILGAVDFGGIVPAAGGVSIAGSCGCGCRGPYLY